MTQMQLDYQKLLETQRHNQAEEQTIPAEIQHILAKTASEITQNDVNKTISALNQARTKLTKYEAALTKVKAGRELTHYWTDIRKELEEMLDRISIKGGIEWFSKNAEGVGQLLKVIYGIA